MQYIARPDLHVYLFGLSVEKTRWKSRLNLDLVMTYTLVLTVDKIYMTATAELLTVCIPFFGKINVTARTHLTIITELHTG